MRRDLDYNENIDDNRPNQVSLTGINSFLFTGLGDNSTQMRERVECGEKRKEYEEQKTGK